MEIKEEEQLCYDYFELVSNINEIAEMTGGMTMYGFNDRREALHDKICELMNIKKEDAYEITNNIDKLENGGELYIALLKLSQNAL